MAELYDRLRAAAPFEELDDDELARMSGEIEPVHLAAGQVLFREGDWGDRAYVVVEGEVEILKSSDRREVLLAVRGPGDVIGEMALLQQEPRTATVRARAAAELIAISEEVLEDVLDSSPHAARVVFETLLARFRAVEEELKHSERMAQLGALTAGVAHELNNPAAAVARAAKQLQSQLDAYTALVGATAPSRDLVEELGTTTGGPRTPADPLARSDAEADVEAWLEEQDVAAGWQLASELVDAGFTRGDLERLEPAVEPGELEHALRVAAASRSLYRTARELAEGAGRLSVIVQALRSYAYLDRAPMQDVDVHRGLEDTLVLLAHKTRRVEVVRDYADDLPTITALGTELNQVWTNLIDNACDALDGVTERTPTLTLRTRLEGDMVVVEVEDNGPGIPEDVRGRVFDTFFTTKGPGRGTGLGLQISHRIVVLEHDGELTVTSEPGRTVFRVALPVARTREPDPDEEESEMPRQDLCDHLNVPMTGERPSGGCQECIDLGDSWVHLRFCNECRKVGCCDDSKNRHARKHAAATGHPVVRSLEEGEDWAWCYEDDMGMSL